MKIADVTTPGNRNNILSYLVLEGLANLYILNEADSNLLSKLLQASGSRLKAKLTPESSNLHLVLALFSPVKTNVGGGAPSAKAYEIVKDLIDYATNHNRSIIENDKWWDMLYRVFGISDDGTKDHIRKTVTQEFEDEGDPRNMVTSAKADRDELEGLLKKVEGRQASIRQALEKKRAESGEAHESYYEVLSAIMESDTASQSITDYIGSIANYIDNSKHHIITEALGSRLHDVLSGFTNNLKTAVSNPKYAASKVDRLQMKNNNERAAKLAINVATDLMMEKYLQTSKALRLPGYKGGFKQLAKQYSKLDDNGKHEFIENLMHNATEAMARLKEQSAGTQPQPQPEQKQNKSMVASKLLGWRVTNELTLDDIIKHPSINGNKKKFIKTMNKNPKKAKKLGQYLDKYGISVETLIALSIGKSNL